MGRSFTHRKTTGDRIRRVVARRSLIAACSVALLLTADRPGSGSSARASEIIVLRSSRDGRLLLTGAVPPGRLAMAAVGSEAQWVPTQGGRGGMDPVAGSAINPAGVTPSAGTAMQQPGYISVQPGSATSGIYPMGQGVGAYPSAQAPAAPSKSYPVAQAPAAPSKSWPQASPPVPSKSLPTTTPSRQAR